MSENFKSRTFNTPDGKRITMFDGKLHSWDVPAITYIDGKRSQDEYYLYGISYSKEDWLEARRDRNGVTPDKNPQVKSRF
jgi:hypothetical protein